MYHLIANQLTGLHKQKHTGKAIPLPGADKFLARPTSRCIIFMVRIFRLMQVLLYI
jgi:hypothetical protein